jgi:hypothetical protein
MAATQGLDGHWFAGTLRPGVPPIRIWLRSDGDCVIIEVWDACGEEPQPQEPAPDAESGRGLMLVEALSAYAGVDRLECASGKICRAVVVASGHRVIKATQR